MEFYPFKNLYLSFRTILAIVPISISAKKMKICYHFIMYQSDYVISDECLNNRNHSWQSRAFRYVLTIQWYYKPNNGISKHVHGSESKSNCDEIRAVVDLVIILNFVEFENSCSRKFQVITISTTGHISSLFNLYLNSWTYSKTTAYNSSYTAFSVSFDFLHLVDRKTVFRWDSSQRISKRVWAVLSKFERRITKCKKSIGWI